MINKPLILRQNKNLKYLPLAFNNNIGVVNQRLSVGYSDFEVIQVQKVNDILFRVDRQIHRENIYELFGAQIELTLDILKYLNENIDAYERYELLQGFVSEFNLMKQLATKPAFDILAHHIDFMSNELIPLVNNHIERIDEELKIKNHKSFVRKNLIDRGLIRFSKGINGNALKEILAFLKVKCVNQNDFLALESELCDGKLSALEYYDLVDVTPDEMIMFFKIMKEREILSKITNVGLANWLHRKFRYNKDGDYLFGQSKRTTLDKFNVRLTSKDLLRELNIHFKK